MEMNINCCKDTMAHNNSPTTNFGSASSYVFQNAPDNIIAYFGFGILNAPEAAEVNSVTFSLYIDPNHDWRKVNWRRVTGTWYEMDLTMQFRPAFTTLHQFEAWLISEGWWEYDVTDLYKDAKNAGTEFSFQLFSVQDRPNWCRVYSRESPWIPWIKIDYNLLPRYVKSTGGNDSNSGDSWANAWATVNKAATTVLDGTEVHIGFGTYNAEPVGNKIAPQNIGQYGIKYLCETETTGGGTGSVIIDKN